MQIHTEDFQWSGDRPTIKLSNGTNYHIREIIRMGIPAIEIIKDSRTCDKIIIHPQAFNAVEIQ